MKKEHFYIAFQQALQWDKAIKAMKVQKKMQEKTDTEAKAARLKENEQGGRYTRH